MINLIFPKQCLICKKKWKNICDTCRKKIKLHTEICYVCHKKSCGFDTHQYCLNDDFCIKKMVIWFEYRKEMKKILLNFKYYHRKVLVEILWYMLYEIYLLYFHNVDDISFTYVPMYWIRKFFVKWYNQSELLATYLAKKTKKPLVKICKKIRNTKIQAWLKRQERLLNLKWSFEMVSKIKIKTKNVLIIDDVITTWTTLNSIAKCIKKSYPKINIYWLVLWRN